MMHGCPHGISLRFQERLRDSQLRQWLPQNHNSPPLHMISNFRILEQDLLQIHYFDVAAVCEITLWNMFIAF